MSATHASDGEDASAGERLVEIVAAPAVPEDSALTQADVLARMTEAEDTLRAIGAGEVDAFVVSDGGTGRRVFTLSTADRDAPDAVAEGVDGAGDVDAGRVRQRHGERALQVAPADAAVHRVERRRCDAEADFAGAGDGLLDVLVAEDIGVAVLVETHCLHLGPRFVDPGVLRI